MKPCSTDLSTLHFARDPAATQESVQSIFYSTPGGSLNHANLRRHLQPLSSHMSGTSSRPPPRLTRQDAFLRGKLKNESWFIVLYTKACQRRYIIVRHECYFEWWHISPYSTTLQDMLQYDRAIDQITMSMLGSTVSAFWPWRSLYISWRKTLEVTSIKLVLSICFHLLHPTNIAVHVIPFTIPIC